MKRFDSSIDAQLVEFVNNCDTSRAWFSMQLHLYDEIGVFWTSSACRQKGDNGYTHSL